MKNLAPEVLSKTAYEERIFAFEWANRLDDSEIISSPTIAQTPSGLTITGTVVSGTQVRCKIASGTINTKYQLTCKVETNTGQKFEGTGLLVVIPPGPLS